MVPDGALSKDIANHAVMLLNTYPGYAKVCVGVLH